MKEHAPSGPERRTGDFAHRRTAKLVDAWPARAAVRRQRYPFEEAGAFDPRRPDYPVRLVPFAEHPGFLAASLRQRQAVLTLAWLAYNARVIAAEQEIALPAMRSIVSGRFAELDRASLRRGVQQSIVDEEFHVYIHMVAVEATERRRGLQLPVACPPSVIVRHYRHAMGVTEAPWQRHLATLAWMIVSEVSINAYLNLLSADEDIQPNHRRVVQLHARDENVHSSIMMDVAAALFSTLTDVQRAYFVAILPAVLRSFIVQDAREWVAILNAAHLDDAERIVQDASSPATPLLTRDFSGVELLAGELGIAPCFDFPAATVRS